MTNRSGRGGKNHRVEQGLHLIENYGEINFLNAVLLNRILGFLCKSGRYPFRFSTQVV